MINKHKKEYYISNKSRHVLDIYCRVKYFNCLISFKFKNHLNEIDTLAILILLRKKVDYRKVKQLYQTTQCWSLTDKKTQFLV